MKNQLLMVVFAVSAYAVAVKEQVDTINHSCGPGTGTMYTGMYGCDLNDSRYGCCSKFGFCGNTVGYCGGGCRPDFGKCGFSPPEKVYQRQLIGNVPYGTIIQDCVKQKTFAIGISNGPSKNTPRLLKMLRTRYPDAKVTFFMESGRTPIDSVKNVVLIKQIIDDGHQVATQGDSHADFDTLTTAFIQAEFQAFEENTFRTLGGKVSTYFRPPFLRCNQHCLDVTKSMGYHVITRNSDPSDYNNKKDMTPSKKYFQNQFGNRPNDQGFITIVDETLNHSVDDLIPFAIEQATKSGYKVVTVGDCLDDPKENWYRKYTGDDGTPLSNP